MLYWRVWIGDVHLMGQFELAQTRKSGPAHLSGMGTGTMVGHLHITWDLTYAHKDPRSKYLGSGNGGQHLFGW